MAKAAQGRTVEVVIDCYELAGRGPDAGTGVGVGPPQMKSAYGTGRRCGGRGRLAQYGAKQIASARHAAGTM